MSFLDLYLSGTPLVAGNTNIVGRDKLGTNVFSYTSTTTANDDVKTPAATIFGVPFDSTHSYKPGCRFGADAIREAFNNIEVFHPDLKVDLEDVHIQDLGNITHTVSATQMLNMVSKVTKEIIDKNTLNSPLFILGGEHLITLGTYPAFPKNTGYVVFDAHYDLREQYADATLSHASYLRRIVDNCDDHNVDNILHVGARAFAAEELEFLKKYGIATITDKQIRDGLAPALLKDVITTFDKTYASFDLDVLDPAYAPGVGNPETEGITSRELFDMVHVMQNTKIVGVDIVELNPIYDTGATAALAAKIISKITAMSLSS